MTGQQEECPFHTHLGWAWSRPGAAGIEETEKAALARLTGRDEARAQPDAHLASGAAVRGS